MAKSFKLIGRTDDTATIEFLVYPTGVVPFPKGEDGKDLTGLALYKALNDAAVELSNNFRAALPPEQRINTVDTTLEPSLGIEEASE